jgi:hypothetical protein
MDWPIEVGFGVIKVILEMGGDQTTCFVPEEPEKTI